MAIPRLVQGHIEYATPLAVIDAAPEGYVYIHFAWFHRWRRHWLAEWAGFVPRPEIDPDLVGDAWLAAMNQWRRRVQDQLEDHSCLDHAIDLEAWAACLAEGPGRGVCVDVTRYGWPVGDYVWCRYNPVLHDIEWPEEHTFIEVRTDTLEVVANQRSHRPIRDAVPGQRVIDITHTPWARFYGSIFGRFVWREAEGRWGFEPTTTRRRWSWRHPITSWCARGAPLVPPAVRAALAEAPIDLHLLTPGTVREKVPA